MSENELKHWGILGQLWNRRRFQNYDGSLTPEGRERYGVGEPRKKKLLVTKEGQKETTTYNDGSTNEKYTYKDGSTKETIIKGNKKTVIETKDGKHKVKKFKIANHNKKEKNVEDSIKEILGIKKSPEDMTDEELYRDAKRLKAQNQYLSTQNQYLKTVAEYKSLTHPPKKTSQFVNKVILQPVENVLARNVEFGLMAMGASFMDATNAKYTDQYMSYIFRNNNNNNNNKNNNNNNNDHNNRRN